MKKYYEIRDIRSAVRRMTDEECMNVYKRERVAYLAELNEEYQEWQEHFRNMFY